MKTFLFSVLGILATFSLFLVSSCEEDKCKTVLCAYGGTCNDEGYCVCPVGYEGERCETITRKKFVGVWTVVEDGSLSNHAVYPVTIDEGVNIDDVTIRNFYNLFNANVHAKVKGDTIYIPTQDMQEGEDIKTIEGRGYHVAEDHYNEHGRLIMRYKVTSSDGSVDNFGTSGSSDNPSVWTK